jgi:D-3-phosphoglycerate dehydrogenase
MRYVVAVADRVADAGLALLRAEPNLEVVVVVGQPERLREELRRAHALIVRSDTTVTREHITAAPNLMVVARAGAGVDNIDVEAATRRGIAVLNAAGANTVSAAEHAVALLFALVRRIPAAAVSMREGQWDRRQFAGSELNGKRMGIVGLGRVGVRVATIGRALGMQVIAHDPYLPEERARGLGIELLSLDDLLAQADVISLHLPLTDETRHLLDRKRLAQMKPSAVVINTARGGLIDNKALLEALEARRLGGAALDVFDPEPLPAESPLRQADGLLLTPHLAASTPEAQDRVATEICRSVRDALLRGALRGAVNLPGVSSDALSRVASVLELARRLGRLAAGIAAGPVNAIEVVYGGSDEAAPRPAMLAAVEGVLTATGVAQVSLVNAAERAAQRGIEISRRAGGPLSGFETTVGVVLQSGGRSIAVEGALIGDRVGRIVRIDRYHVDVPAEGFVVVLRNRDVPGVIGRVGSVLGEAEINIGSYHQSRSRDESGTTALAAIVVDHAPDAAAVASLRNLADVLEVRVASLNGVAAG